MVPIPDDECLCSIEKIIIIKMFLLHLLPLMQLEILMQNMWSDQPQEGPRFGE